MERAANQLKVPVYASLALAFASFGDAFLYPFLPLYAQQTGMPLFWVGLILSINRFVRIFSNELLLFAFSRYGFRTVTLFSAAVAAFSTAAYGIGAGLLLWLVARVVWGLAFSALRTSQLSYALEGRPQGLSLGLSMGVYETGPLLALLLAPLLLNFSSPLTTFLFLSAASVPALFFAWHLPDLPPYISTFKGLSVFRFPSSLNLLTFLTAFIVEGLLIVVLGVLLQNYEMSSGTAISKFTGTEITTITALAAGFLAARRICFMLLSPAGGWLARRTGFEALFLSSILFISGGLFLLAAEWLMCGLLLIFISNSLFATTAPAAVSTGANDKVLAVAENASWRDIGAAFGALAGGFLISAEQLSLLFILAAMLLLGLLIRHIKGTTYSLKHLFSWK